MRHFPMGLESKDRGPFNQTAALDGHKGDDVGVGVDDGDASALRVPPSSISCPDRSHEHLRTYWLQAPPRIAHYYLPSTHRSHAPSSTSLALSNHRSTPPLEHPHNPKSQTGGPRLISAAGDRRRTAPSSGSGRASGSSTRIAMAAHSRWRLPQLLLALALAAAAGVLVCASGGAHLNGGPRHQAPHGPSDLARRSRRAAEGGIGRGRAAVGIDAGPGAGGSEVARAISQQQDWRLQVCICWSIVL